MALIKCKECGHEVSSEAETCPKCGAEVAGKSMGCGTIVGILLIVGIIALIAGGNSSNNSESNSSPSEPTPLPKSSQTRDDSRNFISIFGDPDLIVSSENEFPRPHIVTKQFIYQKENVRAVFVADVPVDTPPPYDAWKLLGFQDQRTDQPISIDEMQRRMGKNITK